ncbi:OmpP1/FadL family transporter [Pedobacter arcticus]|uniref:OmpP1/FadL family transporter n=1 Tax=Pedobacter arcticus TaxID=752140 RepID=UPI0002D39C28|nr:outer membrane protein transport protein [Pedobacter arcticus]
MIRKILLGACLAMPATILAQGFQVNLQGQKQIGMAGTGVGTVMDGASIFFNPGAVSMLKENQVNLGVSPLFFKSAFLQSGSSTVENNKDEIAPPFEAYAVWGPKSGRYKLGIGAYTPFGGLVNWGDEWSGKYSLISLSLKAIYIQPTVSVKITDNIGLGAGFVYNHGEVNLQKAVAITQGNGQDSRATLKGTGEGYGWNAGIYFKTLSGVSIGVTHRSKVVTKLNDGDAIFDFPASIPAASLPTKFTSQLPLPATTSLGFGFYPSAKTTIAFDASWVHWSVYKELAFDYNVNTTVPDTKSPRNYGDGASLKLGINQQQTEKLALRAGIGYAFTPVKDGYVTPEAPDANRFILSAGLGYDISKKFVIDLSFLYEAVKEREQTNLESNLSGTFKTHVYIPGIGVSYKF